MASNVRRDRGEGRGRDWKERDNRGGDGTGRSVHTTAHSVVILAQWQQKQWRPVTSHHMLRGAIEARVAESFYSLLFTF